MGHENKVNLEMNDFTLIFRLSHLRTGLHFKNELSFESLHIRISHRKQ